MADIKLIIDGAEVRVNQGTTVLQAAQSAGIYIAPLCSPPGLSSSREVKPDELIYRDTEAFRNYSSAEKLEGCQLCVVEIEGGRIDI